MKIHLLRFPDLPTARPVRRPTDPRQGAAPEPQQAGTLDATVKSYEHSIARLDADMAAAKAQQIAEVIQRRRDSGFYHRPEVLHAATERLLESGDLVRVRP